MVARVIGSVRSAVRRHGIRGVLRRGALWLRYRVWATEQHFWLHLDLTGDLPHRELPEGLELVRASDADASALGMGPGRVTRRLAEGHDLWLVREGDQAAFSCSIFRRRGPAFGSPGGWFTVPPDTVFIEDSVTSPAFRGRGMIAPGAWVGIAASLRAEGVQSMITRVPVDNVLARKAFLRAGFKDVGEMRVTRRGPRFTVRFGDMQGQTGRILAQTFER